MIDTVEASKRLGLLRTTVTDLAGKGILKAKKFGAAWSIEESSVQEFARCFGLPAKETQP